MPEFFRRITEEGRSFCALVVPTVSVCARNFECGKCPDKATCVMVGQAEVDMPDEYFIRVKGNNIAYGKERGVLQLSRIGYEFFREQIKTAYEAGNHALPWDDFRKELERSLWEIKDSAKKRMKNLQAKLKELKIAMNVL